MELTLIGVFLEGILSFLSPCVLPLLPLYMSYLAGEDKTEDENGNVKYNTKKVFVSTIFFVLGISFTFLLLTASLDYISSFIEEYAPIISIIGGTLLIIFGLHELGLITIDLLNKELKPHANFHLEKMSFFKAFLLGFVFSLGWSPCIGPMLASAIFLAATSSQGYLYIVAYALGLIIPFLLTGLLTSSILNFFKSNKKILSYVLKIAGIIIICFGVYMIVDASKTITSYKKNNGTQSVSDMILDHEFKDQYGNTIKLSNYKDEYVMIDITTTWCAACKSEMPLYTEFANENLCKCFYVYSPGAGDIDLESTINYLNENNVTVPVILDTEGLIQYYLGVSAYPTKFIIYNNEFVCYVQGAFSVKEGYEEFLDYAKKVIEKKAEN